MCVCVCHAVVCRDYAQGRRGQQRTGTTKATIQFRNSHACVVPSCVVITCRVDRDNTGEDGKPAMKMLSALFPHACVVPSCVVITCRADGDNTGEDGKPAMKMLSA